MKSGIPGVYDIVVGRAMIDASGWLGMSPQRLFAIAATCVFMCGITACVESSRLDTATGNEANLSPLDELAHTVLCGHGTEAEDAALELAARADASRKWFEVFLLGSRRDDVGVSVMSAESAERWARRHRKALYYLEDDVSGPTCDRSYLASRCLGKPEVDDQNLLVGMDVGHLLNAIEGKLFFARGLDEADTSWDKLFFRSIEDQLLLGRTVKARGLGRLLPAEKAEAMVQEATGVPVVWHPKHLRATKPIEIVAEDPARREGEVGVYQLLYGLVAAGAYERPDVDAMTAMVIATRKAIFIIGLPSGAKGTGAKH